MKRIIESRKLFNVNHDAELGHLKSTYRNLMKEWHPDKFSEGDERLVEAEHKSKAIIEAYHLLVSVSPETHKSNAEEYSITTINSAIEDLFYKGQTLKITFQDGSIYEYFGVPRNIYLKMINSPTLTRFARRHIFNSYLYRNHTKRCL